jgi:hypothetical protein
VLVSDRTGTVERYGLLQPAGASELFIGAGVEVYEGMIVGENSRSGDMDVNPAKEKKLTNIRTHSHDEALRLTAAAPAHARGRARVHRRRRARRGDAGPPLRLRKRLVVPARSASEKAAAPRTCGPGPQNRPSSA